VTHPIGRFSLFSWWICPPPNKPNRPLLISPFITTISFSLSLDPCWFGGSIHRLNFHIRFKTNCFRRTESEVKTKVYVELCTTRNLVWSSILFRIPWVSCVVRFFFCDYVLITWLVYPFSLLSHGWILYMYLVQWWCIVRVI